MQNFYNLFCRSMGDIDGPFVARKIYEQLLATDSATLNLDTVPYALDDAINELKKRGLHSDRWATYVHVGI